MSLKRTSALATPPLELTRLFEESGCTVSQWHDMHRARVPSGERRLMLAILEDAIAAAGVDPFTSSAKVRALRAEARAWLMSDDRAWLFSFANICDALGFDVDYLRRGVRARTVVVAVAAKPMAAVAAH